MAGWYTLSHGNYQKPCDNIEHSGINKQIKCWFILKEILNPYSLVLRLGPSNGAWKLPGLHGFVSMWMVRVKELREYVGGKG